MKNIPHLHVHSTFSTLDGVPSPGTYLKACDEMEIPAIAFTEHGNMGSHAEASIESHKYKTKTILGIEIYVTPSVRKLEEVRGKADDKSKATLKAIRKATSHLVLLATNSVGYNNLVRINNDSWTRGIYYRNQTDFEMLSKYQEGLIALSACQSGVVSKPLLNDKTSPELRRGIAIKRAKNLKEIFGKNFFLELQFLDMEIQDKLNKKLVKLGKHLDIPFVLTNDVHYIGKKDWRLQRILFDMMKVDMEFGSKVNYLKTLEDFENDFKIHGSLPRKVFESAIDNVHRIAADCNHVVETGKLYFPLFDHTTHYFYNKTPVQDKQAFFKTLVLHRAKETLGSKIGFSEYRKRIVREFNTLVRLGGIDYFLIVDDLLNYVRSKGAFSVIRGSANGSLIAFVLGFGLIDPIKHGIMFERFISKYRSLNDIDIDIDVRSEFRQEAISYLKKKYGDNRVLSVGTYNRMQLKGSIKDVTRVFKNRLDEKIKVAKTEEESERYLERQKQYLFPVINRVTSTMEGDLDVKTALKQHEAFKNWYGNNEKLMKTYVEPLVGNIKNISLHPAGVVIIPEGREEILPIRTQIDARKKSQRIIATVWENSHTGREDLNEVGVMALDILGVKTLSIVSDVIEMVEKTQGVKIDLYKLPLDDKKTLKMFNKREVIGVFQFSGGASRQVIDITKITEFNDLVAITAIARPGALGAKAEVAYAERKTNPSLVKYDHHSLSTILNDSLGVLVFSEHILRTASEFAGMKPREADSLRKIIKGKNPAAFKKYKKKFISGAIKKWKKEPNIKKTADLIWKKFSQAGGYLFPRGHAASYALLGYICMYLKVHFPVEFFACHLRYATQEKYSSIKFIAERIYKIKFIMPNINNPKLTFEPSGDSIYWPLTALKSVGVKAAQTIIENAPFTSVEDFLEKVNKTSCNKRVVENLIIAGALDDFGSSPRGIELEYLEVRRVKMKIAKADPPKQFDSRENLLAAREDVFGFELEPLEKLYAKKLKKFGKMTDYNEFMNLISGDEVRVFGRVGKLHKIKTKKGDTMAFASIKNGRQAYTITLFPEAFRIVETHFSVGNIIVVNGVKNIYNKEHSIILETRRSGKTVLGLSHGNWVKEI